MTRVEGNKPSLLTDLLGLVKLSLPLQAPQLQSGKSGRDGERDALRNFVPDPLRVHPAFTLAMHYGASKQMAVRHLRPSARTRARVYAAS